MDKGVHKETFMQATREGIPQHWVVFYWPEEVFAGWEGAYKDSHLGSAIEASCFESFEDADEFERTLEPYDEWYDRQEIPLAVQ